MLWYVQLSPNPSFCQSSMKIAVKALLLIFRKTLDVDLGHSLSAGVGHVLFSVTEMEWSGGVGVFPGVFWPAHAGVAAMAGGSEHAPEEERVRGQAALGQQAG